MRKLHQTVKKATEDFESRWHFNTSIAAIMELMNELTAIENQLSGDTLREALEKLILLLGPFAPYLAEEMWEEMGRQGPVFRQPWPDYDPALAKQEEVDVVVQVNGKLRGRVTVPAGAAREELENRALDNTRVRQFTAGKTVIKVIVVPDKLVNIVVR